MGIFGNSISDEFKDKFIQLNRLMSQFSEGTVRLPDSTTLIKIDANFQELKNIANRFANPYADTFKFHVDSVFAERITIAEGLLLVSFIYEETVVARKKLTLDKQKYLIIRAKREINTNSGRFMVDLLLQEGL